MTVPCRILLVRLGSLGDIVHALPVASSLRQAFPDARLDWVVDERNREILDLVPAIDRRIVLQTQSLPAWRAAVRTVCELRRQRYDVALDLQGLLKSAVLARASGARRVIGFPRADLRERAARVFYTDTSAPGGTRHVIDKNLALAATLEIATGDKQFPLVPQASSVPAAVRSSLAVGGDGRYALLNPGAAWPNKRWPTTRFGELARWLRSQHGLPSAVVWGPGEQSLAYEVAAASAGSAEVAPATSVADLVALARDAALVVSGDTGPLHIAAATGAPVVGIYGPTDPARNGPWSPEDLTVSRFTQCQCHHHRRCHAKTWCLYEISAEEVIATVDNRLNRLARHA